MCHLSAQRQIDIRLTNNNRWKHITFVPQKKIANSIGIQLRCSFSRVYYKEFTFGLSEQCANQTVDFRITIIAWYQYLILKWIHSICSPQKIACTLCIYSNPLQIGWIALCVRMKGVFFLFHFCANRREKLVSSKCLVRMLAHIELIEANWNAPDCIIGSPFWLIRCECTGFFTLALLCMQFTIIWFELDFKIESIQFLSLARIIINRRVRRPCSSTLLNQCWSRKRRN